MRPEALIRHVVGGAGAGFVVFRDVRGLLSVARAGSDVFSDLQGHELPADAAGVLVWCGVRRPTTSRLGTLSLALWWPGRGSLGGW